MPNETLRILLAFCLLGMALLAVFYLRARALPVWAYFLWGLVALLLPGLGPMLVLLFRPGRSQPKEIH